ncbi:MAG: 30S ribosomal protein S8 [archaeon]
MSLNDPLANVLSHILIEDKKGRKIVTLKPSSKIIKDVLNIFNQNNYVGTYTENADTKGSTLTLNLLGNINKCGVIKPRFNVKSDEFEKFEKRYLPAYGFGFLIVSTNKGIMTQEEARKKNPGGKLIAYVY